MPININYDQDDFEVLDPATSLSSSAVTMLYNLYDGLYRNEGARIVPAVAERAIISEDRRTYTFQLKQTFWSDGRPVTACNFRHAWLRALESPHYRSYFQHIRGAEAVANGDKGHEHLGVETAMSPKN